MKIKFHNSKYLVGALNIVKIYIMILHMFSKNNWGSNSKTI